MYEKVKTLMRKGDVTCLTQRNTLPPAWGWTSVSVTCRNSCCVTVQNCMYSMTGLLDGWMYVSYYVLHRVIDRSVFERRSRPIIKHQHRTTLKWRLTTINSAASIDSKLAAGCMDPSSKQWKTQHVQIRFTQRGPKLPEVTIRERIQRGCSRLPTRWYIARWRSIRIIKCASSLWLAGLRIWFY